MNKQITFILGSLNRGGAERVISILSRDYAEKGWDVHVLLLLFGNVQYDMHPSVHIHNLSNENCSRIRQLPFWLKNIRKHIKTVKPDVVLSFAARINIITQIACLGLKQTIFVSERNDPRMDGRSKLVDFATRILYPKASGVIFQTKQAASCFPTLKNAEIIVNPISVTAYASEQKADKIVTVGRLTAQKNQKMLVDAFARISNKIPHILEIYGEDELYDALVKQIKELGLENRVFMMGNVSNIHERIADSRAFVLSSNYEGLSNALLEAMMMGLPCISTNCAGSDEHICHGENGYLVPVGDADSMALAIETLLSDEEKQKQLGSAAAEYAVKFQKEAVLRQWHSFMDKEVL